MSPSTPATPLLATQTRPHTLRRAARRIEFGSLRAASPVLSGESGTCEQCSQMPISSTYLVRAHPFAPDQSFSSSNRQRTPTFTCSFVRHHA
ncbi:hypothetical protein EV702DRAFT_1202536 [Suillus placidus]|uniref:Uncharacterized protein n=1 Tax=Suillus placidus TaxID=48579 RepID=A0A9P6ZKE2_9AGAM|nr:hypothetical protein EV702DRAFT_1202536 [Suillus placidus]